MLFQRGLFNFTTIAALDSDELKGYVEYVIAFGDPWQGHC